MTKNAHEKITYKASSPVYLLNAAVHNIPTESSLIFPSFGFATSLNDKLDEEFDIVGFNLNSHYTRIFILEGDEKQLEQVIDKVKKEMVSLIKSWYVECIDEIYMNDSFLVWPISGENKYLCVISSVCSDGLQDRLEGRDLAEKENIFFESFNMDFPEDFSLKSKKLFLEQRHKRITAGAGRLDKVWGIMSQLDKNTYEIMQQKKCLFENIKSISELEISNAHKTSNKI